MDELRFDVVQAAIDLMHDVDRYFFPNIILSRIEYLSYTIKALMNQIREEEPDLEVDDRAVEKSALELLAELGEGNEDYSERRLIRNLCYRLAKGDVLYGETYGEAEEILFDLSRYLYILNRISKDLRVSCEMVVSGRYLIF